MTSTSYRYISVELGKGEQGNPNRIYNTLLIVHFCLALFLLVIGLSIGLWYINNFLNVPVNKVSDARFVFIVSIITTVFTIVSVPSNGLIIAKEKFVFTSFVEIIQNIVKVFLIILLLKPYQGDKLRLYAVLLALINMSSPIIYTIYCFIKEKSISAWNFNNKVKDYKEILVFTFWMLIGAIACVGTNQGAALIINAFFNTVINAAFGIASQVQSYILLFVRSLTQAANPQIMKNIGGGNEERSLKIVYKISKYSFYIMLLLSVPIMLSINEVLLLWLKVVPQGTSMFTFLLLVNGIIACVGSGFDVVIQASGKIRNNQIGYSLINISLLPITYLLYKMGYPFYSNVIILILLTLFTICFQAYIMKRISMFSIKKYLLITILPILKVLLFIVPLIFLKRVIPNNIEWIIIYTLFVEFWLISAFYFVGSDKNEKNIIINIVKTRFRDGRNSSVI